MTTKIDKLITYLAILQETLKAKKQAGINTRYTSVEVDIHIPDDLIVHEHWQSESDLYHTIEFPISDIDSRIKIARDHLRYIKKRPRGQKHGE